MIRRGASDTFDKIKFKKDLSFLRDKCEGSFPSFDHAKKDPIENDVIISKEIKIVVIEGLYLLMKDWDLFDLFDMKIFIKCD